MKIMKNIRNKFILAFLLIPVVIGCQNTTVVQNSSSPKPTSSVNVAAFPTSVISNIAVSPTPNVSSSPSIKPTPSDISESVTPIIESNMKYLPEEKKDVILIDSVKKDKFGFIFGNIYDYKNNSISNVNVTLKKSPNIIIDDPFIKYDFSDNKVSNVDGKYGFKTPGIMSVIITAEKKGYTKRAIETRSLYSEGLSPISDNFECTNNLSNCLSNSPEIRSIYINNNLISIYDLNKFSEEKVFINQDSHIVNPNISIPRFTMINSQELVIKIYFNKEIDKNSFEKNLYLDSLDKTTSYNQNANNIFFEWDDNKLEVIVYVRLIKQNSRTKYKLGFKQSFLDTYSNKIFNNQYISLQLRDFRSYTELSENIVFEIEGSK